MPSPYVQLTICNEPGYISALEILSYEDGSPKGGREVAAPSDEADNFVADCLGWSAPAHSPARYREDGSYIDKADSFDEGFGVVLQIRSDDWAAWLEQFEVDELPAYAVAALTD